MYFFYDTLMGNCLVIYAAFPGADYLWSTGQSNSLIWVSDTGLYSVTASNACNSVVDSVVVLSLTDIQNFKLSDKIEIYPNPVKGELVIEGLSVRNYEITLWNSIGQAVVTTTQTLAWSESLGFCVIDFSGFPKGIYLLGIRLGEERKVYKVVRE